MAGSGRMDPTSRRIRTASVPAILVVLGVIVLFWYAMAVVMNAPWQERLNGRAKLTDVPATEFALQTWAQEKPVLPAPHQVIAEIWNATVATGPSSSTRCTQPWVPPSRSRTLRWKPPVRLRPMSRLKLVVISGQTR